MYLHGGQETVRLISSRIYESLCVGVFTSKASPVADGPFSGGSHDSNSLKTRSQHSAITVAKGPSNWESDETDTKKPVSNQIYYLIKKILK